MAAADSRERWALGASMLLHAAVAGLFVVAVMTAPPERLPVDIWAGTGQFVGVQVEAWKEATAPGSLTHSEPLEPRASEEAEPAAALAERPEAVRAPAPSVQAPEAVEPATRQAPEPADEYGEQWIKVEDQLDSEAAPPSEGEPPAESANAPSDAIFAFGAKPSVPAVAASTAPAVEPVPIPASKSAQRAAPPIRPVVPPEQRRASAPGPTGGMEAPAGRRQLGRAFARAIPAAGSGDLVWNRLPLGPAGQTTIRIAVEDDGSLAPVEHSDGTPLHLERLVDRTLLALMGGRFALSDRAEQTLTLRLELTVSQRPASSGPLELGFEPPTPFEPGRAYFQLPSGRFVELRITEIGRRAPARQTP